MADRKDSIAGYVDILRRRAPELLDFLTARNDEEFDAALDVLLEIAVSKLEANSKNFTELDEVGLTGVLAMGLSMPGLTVTQEANSNGHVDITILADHTYPLRKRLGEAKIYKGPKKHIDGVGQLFKYMTGRDKKGLLIAYFRTDNIATRVKSLRARMDKELPYKQQGITADHTMEWSFISKHKHSSESLVHVEHIACNLNPRQT